MSESGSGYCTAHDGTSSVLERAFAILDAFDHSRRTISVSTIMHRTGFPKSTTYRLLGSLIELGAVERHPRGYRLGYRVLTLGVSAAERSIRDLALPHLTALHHRWEATVHMAVPDGQMVVFVEKLCGPASIATPVDVGCRLPARSTAVGQVLLAHSRGPECAIRREAKPSVTAHPRGLRQLDIHSSEVAYDHGHLSSGLSCLAAPIVVNASAVAAISIAYASAAGNAPHLIDPLCATARSIGSALAEANGSMPTPW